MREQQHQTEQGPKPAVLGGDHEVIPDRPAIFVANAQAWAQGQAAGVWLDPTRHPGELEACLWSLGINPDTSEWIVIDQVHLGAEMVDELDLCGGPQ